MLLLLSCRKGEARMTAGNLKMWSWREGLEGMAALLWGSECSLKHKELMVGSGMPHVELSWLCNAFGTSGEQSPAKVWKLTSAINCNQLMITTVHLMSFGVSS